MTQFGPVLVLLALAVSLVLVGYGLSTMLAVRRIAVDVPAFSGGVPPAEHAVSRFHVRWYPVTLVFLAFDMEMVFMYPWAVVVADVGVGAVVEMFGFLAVLFVGVVYAWREGALRWT